MDEGNALMSREDYAELLNDLDIGILDIYCEKCGLKVIINNGRITDYAIKKEVTIV